MCELLLFYSIMDLVSFILHCSEADWSARHHSLPSLGKQYQRRQRPPHQSWYTRHPVKGFAYCSEHLQRRWSWYCERLVRAESAALWGFCCPLPPYYCFYSSSVYCQCRHSPRRLWICLGAWRRVWFQIQSFAFGPFRLAESRDDRPEMTLLIVLIWGRGRWQSLVRAR